ncbi:hypothetical protein GZ77_13265 [Endozoicomonas montiporae]|uniref:Ion channel protein Tsx n=1 Tax=Endozoicomonas montiporae TaxID=1027273 RepID=A0A081N4K0_9GAMM|nr:hypothetical protein GZ77_13265 [Endozoicomonas montiporae]
MPAGMLSTSVNAEYLYGFSNIQLNHLDWTKSTENKTEQRDFTYIRLEGGSGYSWGELYGFLDLENPTKSSGRTVRARHEDGRVNDGRRVAMKGNARVNIGDTGFNLFGQIFDISGQKFDEQNRFYGFGYNLVGRNFFFKPFLAAHHAQSTYFNGSNGYVLGWTASYDFSAINQKFTLFNWHETEFSRDKEYLRVNNKSEKTGHNGALELWWHATDSITAGLQYRYASDKLGYAENQDGVIYSLKYNF